MTALAKGLKQAILVMLIGMGLGLSTASASAREVIGTLTKLQGSGSALYNAEQRPLAVGAVLYQDDTVETGDGSRVLITLADGSELTLGEHAAMLLSDQIVTPPGIERGPVMTLLRGVFALAASKTAGAEIKTPVATIGIRGTRLWGGPLNGALDVLLFEGKIDVTTPGGMVVLDQPGQGTVIAGAGQAPGPVGVWPAAKVERAKASVAFR